jgi:hypothetical protein
MQILLKENLLKNSGDPKYNFPNGTETFLNFYEEILSFRKEDTKNINPIWVSDYFDSWERIQEKLTDNINHIVKIPRIGTCSEVLFYIALKKLNIFVEPSTLKGDQNGHRDFSVLGYPTDISTLYPRKDYRRKFTKGNNRVLLVPIITSYWRNRFNSTDYFPNEVSYAHDLIINNHFNYNDYISETLEINKFILNLIQDNIGFNETNRYGLCKNQFGNVPERFINQQINFLELLSDFYTPLDKN